VTSILALALLVGGCSQPYAFPAPERPEQADWQAKRRAPVAPPKAYDAPLTPSDGEEHAASVAIVASPASLLAGQRSRVLLLVSLTSQLRSARRPLAIGLVLDRSGSMEVEQKIHYARAAAHLLVSNLLAQDRFAMITFASRAQVVAGSAFVRNKSLLHHRIEEISAAGYTNLSGGLLAGYAELDEKAPEQPPRALLLVSDGLANRGITDRDRLTEIARTYRMRGVSLSTIGLGLDYDESLLAALARAGGGRYTHVEKAEGLPGACARELRGLLGVAVQNISLELSFHKSVRLLSSFGGDQRRQVEPGETVLDLGDLQASGIRRILLQIEVQPTVEQRRFKAGLLVVRYQDARSGVTVTERLPLTFVVTSDARLRDRSRRADVEARHRLQEMFDILHMALASRDATATTQARQVFSALLPGLEAIAANSGDIDLQDQVEYAEHLHQEMQSMARSGGTHAHDKARSRLKKEVEYRRYLLYHHLRPAESRGHGKK